jgi:hypothetical protein
MGVDLTIFIGTGYLIKCTDFEKEFPTAIEELWEINELQVASQNSYGNQDKDAYILICDKNSIKELMDRKVGMTPFSFLRNQRYNENDEEIKGGAEKYFAVSLKYLPYEKEETKEKIDKILTEHEDEEVKKLGDWLKERSEQTFSKWLFSYYH